MQQQQSYEALLEASRRVNWRVDDLIGGDKRLDFSRPFLPETYARTAALPFLTPGERLKLNQVLAIVNPDNNSSIKLLEKLGLRFVREKGEVNLYALPDQPVE